MSLYNQGLKNPTAVFKNPQDLVNNQSLSNEQKINILQQWYDDAKLLEIASSENMDAEEDSLLPEIIEALHTLGTGPDVES